MELGQFPPTGFRQHFRILCIQLADNVFSEFYDSFPLVTEIEANGSRIATVSFADNKPALLQRSHELGYVNSLQPRVRGEFSLTRPLPRTHQTMERREHRILGVGQPEVGDRSVNPRPPAQAKVPHQRPRRPYFSILHSNRIHGYYLN